MSKSSIKTGTSSSAVTKKLVFSAVGIALAMVTSYIKVWEMPMGGSVTLLSMLFICLIGYWYGPKYGILAGAAYGILQFVVDPYMLSIPQVALDYPLAFGALGLSGFFSDRKYGLQAGYIVGVLGRFVCSLLSGVIFFASYTPDGMNPWAYSALYQGSYLGAEAVITLVILSLPPVTKALKHVKIQTVIQ
ncbi:energy-coupled thiamine transporter ThiT [Extibacter muris]|uniref:energy-coupled thiamine transporter ThiT n=1 Tax=Extibacter muris TaxID=1796622 RepID=UPI001D093E07|nr:energy-coupled thiamine transporter ThiT [Extibacter muris]MCB6200629.1 energy-coupled thiamine transporter ThiT [Extibacter muris]MCQ4663658.1 energy-coupled thiamine transporter ThiT [Extibacter muris]MCQ4692127.1 energy-coupled thiamine transporter ThiT [Extibacter muris]